MSNHNEVVFDICNSDKSLFTLSSILAGMPERSLSDLMESNDWNSINRLLRKWDLANTVLCCYHITTSGCACRDIEENGLLPLKDVLSRETELASYIKENFGLGFNRDENRFMNSSGKPWVPHEGDLTYIKLYGTYGYDNRVSAFLFFSESGYDSYDRSPEFLRNLAGTFGVDENAINNSWRKKKVPYIVSFIVPFNEVATISDCYHCEEDESELDVKQSLLCYAYNIYRGHDYRNIPITMRDDAKIPPSAICNTSLLGERQFLNGLII